METIIPALRQTDLFGELDSEYLEKIAAITISESYEPGNIVFLAGEQVDGFYVVAEGRAKGYRTSPAGKQQIIRLLEPGDVIAEAAIFAGKGYPVSLEITEPARLLFIPQDKFIELLREDPDFSLQMLAELTHRLRFLVGLVEDLSLREVLARLAKYLLDRAVKENDRLEPGLQVELKSSKQELANMLGTTPETLSRKLKQLAEAGAIERLDSGIKLTNISHLQRLSAGKDN